jgi:hypothetical protein
LIALALAAALATQAQAGPSKNDWIAFGGGDSCATWVSSAANEAVGRFWVMGFWSGRNSGLRLTVGESTDGTA